MIGDMSNFALETTDSYGDVISSINYLLSTSNVLDANVIVTSANALVANVSSGQITTAADPAYVSYLYQYLHVRYADNATGSVNFSTSPTNRLFFGLLNSNSPVGSSNPADYIYTQVVGGFGTTKFFFYSVLGGRQLLINITTGATNNFLQAVDAVPIDLDLVTAVANVVITANNIVASTITGTEIAANTVATTNITSNAISDFGGAFSNGDIIRFSPVANVFYNFTGNVTITTSVANTKISVASQGVISYLSNIGVVGAGATLESNTVIRMVEVSTGLSYVLNYLQYNYTFYTTGNLQQTQDLYYLTGYTTTLPNAGSYIFATYNKYITTGNVTVYVSDVNNKGILVQALKR